MEKRGTGAKKGKNIEMCEMKKVGSKHSINIKQWCHSRAEFCSELALTSRCLGCIQSNFHCFRRPRFGY